MKKIILLEKILGIAMILAAIYSMDFSNWSSSAVFFILCFAGASSLFKNSKSEFYRKLSDVFGRTAFVISIITLIKMLFLGY